MYFSLCSRWPRLFCVIAVTACLSLVSHGVCEEPTITVTGDAEIRVIPDHAIFSIGIESRAKDVAAATEDNDGKTRGVLDFLKKLGIEDKDIRTEFIAIDPIMRSAPGYAPKGNWQQANLPNPFGGDPFDEEAEDTTRQPIGYRVSRGLSITISDLSQFDSLYKGLVERGINRVRSIEFRTSELLKHRDAARLDAVQSARRKAHAMASELGASLASVKTIREARGGAGWVGYPTQSSRSDPFGETITEGSNFAAGQLSITASVEVVFVLGDTELKK